MAGCDGWISIKIFELLFATFCMIYKRVTDDEANKLFYFLQKFSREWPLLNNVTWEENGAIFTNITYGGYIIIVIGLIIGQCTGELQRCRKMENFFLIVGALLFIAAGSLELAALDSVEERLVDNAAILGVFSLVTGFLFIIDLLTAGKRRKSHKLKTFKKFGLSKLTQTEEKSANKMIEAKNGHVQNGGLGLQNGHDDGYRIPKHAVKLLPSSPTMTEYMMNEKNNRQYGEPVEHSVELFPIDGEEFKTEKGKIRSTESFLRSEKGLYPKIMKDSEQDRSNNHYFIPSGYVLVPADHFQTKSITKSDSGIGESYTPPDYAKISHNMKANERYPSKDHARGKQSSGRSSKFLNEMYTMSGHQPSSHSFRENSSDMSDVEESRPEDYYRHDKKVQKYVIQSEESSDERKGSYQNEEFSRPGSRYSQASKDLQNRKGKLNDGFDDDGASSSPTRKSSPYRSSTPFDKPKSILRFDYGRPNKKENRLHIPKSGQYDSLDSQKIADDLRTLKEITKSDASPPRDFEQENQMLKECLRLENKENEKLKRHLEDMKKAGLKINDSDEEKNRRMSEREEQYFGVKDLRQSHRKRDYDFSPTRGGSTKINEKLKEKYLEHEIKSAKEVQEYRDLIDERFHFLDEEEKLKKTSKQKSDSDDTNHSQLTDEEIRLRVETPGSASYKSEARFWLENHREKGTKSPPPLSPASPGYVLYTAQNWPESPSAQDRFKFSAKEAQQLRMGTPPKTPLLGRLSPDFSNLDENKNLKKSQSLDFEESSSSKSHPLTRSKGLLVRKMDATKDIEFEIKKPSAIVASTNTWRKWLQPKQKLAQTKSTPN